MGEIKGLQVQKERDGGGMNGWMERQTDRQGGKETD